jgi:uncharacterized protein DUF3800
LEHNNHGDEFACMQIRCLVSGLPKAEREARIFVSVQVVIDDSNKGQENEPAFILAGFLATVPNWEDFTDAWQNELDHEPSITLLKSSEALNLRWNFAGWSAEERDQRLLAFVKIIRDHVFARVHTSIVKRDFDRIFAGFKGALEKIYPEAVISLVTRTMHFAQRRKMRQPFEYVFDAGILSPNQLKNLHREALQRMPQKARWIKRFRHDTDDNFYPLQAADLYAGYYRAKLVAEANDEVFRSPVLDALLAIPEIDATTTEYQMEFIKRGIGEWQAAGSPKGRRVSKNILREVRKRL